MVRIVNGVPGGCCLRPNMYVVIRSGGIPDGCDIRGFPGGCDLCSFVKRRYTVRREPKWVSLASLSGGCV